MATFYASSGKFSVFSEDLNLLGSTTIHSVPCIGSEMDFCGMLVTINDELHEHFSQASATIPPQVMPQAPPCSQVYSAPTARPPRHEKTFVGISAASGEPICRTDDEVLLLLMPRRMKLTPVVVGDGRHTGITNSSSSSSHLSNIDNITASDSARQCPTNPNPGVISAQPSAPLAQFQSKTSFSTSFRQLPAPQTLYPTNPPSATANVSKSSALGNATILDSVDDESGKHLHQSFKQPRGFAPTCIVNSFESFLETMKQGCLQLPLDLDPTELSKLYEKRHICIPDSFASLSEYASIFRSALWEGNDTAFFTSLMRSNMIFLTW
jgi:hypothetical protein